MLAVDLAERIAPILIEAANTFENIFDYKGSEWLKSFLKFGETSPHF